MDRGVAGLLASGRLIEEKGGSVRLDRGVAGLFASDSRPRGCICRPRGEGRGLENLFYHEIQKGEGP